MTLQNRAVRLEAVALAAGASVAAVAGLVYGLPEAVELGALTFMGFNVGYVVAGAGHAVSRRVRS